MVPLDYYVSRVGTTVARGLSQEASSIVSDFTLGTHPISTKGATEIGGAKRRSDFECLP